MDRTLAEQPPIDDLADIVLGTAASDDGVAAQEHLSAGFPVYFSETDTPAGVVIKAYPDGRREFVRFDLDGEHRVQKAA